MNWKFTKELINKIEIPSRVTKFLVAGGGLGSTKEMFYRVLWSILEKPPFTDTTVQGSPDNVQGEAPGLPQLSTQYGPCNSITSLLYSCALFSALTSLRYSRNPVLATVHDTNVFCPNITHETVCSLFYWSTFLVVQNVLTGSLCSSWSTC